jgi:hypothetical protein
VRQPGVGPGVGPAEWYNRRLVSLAPSSTPAPVVPPERSLVVQFDLAPLHRGWGATWSVVCGAAAVGLALVTVSGVLRLAGVWLVAVPLFGAVWAPWLGRDVSPRIFQLPRWPRGGRPAPEPSDATATGEAVAMAPEAMDSLVAALMALVVASLLGPGPLLLLVAAMLFFLLYGALAEAWPPVVGAMRTILEIIVPGLMAWLALGGVVPVPAPAAVQAGWFGSGLIWLELNWLVPILLGSFAISYHAAITVHRRGELGRRRAEVSAGYVLAICALVLADRVFGAAAVAIIYVAQWPFAAMFRAGHVRWHFQATEGLAMAAMLAALAAAGWG